MLNKVEWRAQKISKDRNIRTLHKEYRVEPLGSEDLLEEGMATHLNILPWRIPMDRGAWQAI